ncbi:hypothetical protein SAY87_001651 [Trapa incisa]|uniref:non-specific serine/threonine protein kinase n=1 Tax=Trapa incisa TaxID=236973 RepID=A0AAN7JUH9_9MYRT|nr:hypothetical protein SAY87_001651 [Trapa incisa]
MARLCMLLPPYWACFFLCSPSHQIVSAALPINGTSHDTCGSMPVKFPFGTGFGCGHPDFSRYIRCSSSSSSSSDTLQFSSGNGVYGVSSIDYSTGTLVLDDPLMSTCSSMQNSGGFSLDRTSPFTLTDGNLFVLLGCSRTSPVFDPDEDLCDTGSPTRVCEGLYSCGAVSGIGLRKNGPTSTCCVYESPTRFGSGGYSLDIQKLQCSSYSTVYGFGDDRGDPMKWKFGISLKYNDSYHTDSCKDCESSGGLCGFSGLGESFACICPNGVNSTSNCYGRGYAWSGIQGCGIQTGMGIAGLLIWCTTLFF